MSISPGWACTWRPSMVMDTVVGASSSGMGVGPLVRAGALAEVGEELVAEAGDGRVGGHDGGGAHEADGRHLVRERHRLHPLVVPRGARERAGGDGVADA